MGLDTSHGCWHGGYAAFSRWRDKVAEVAGYAVWPVIYDGHRLSNGTGFGNPTIMLDWGHVTDDNMVGRWTETPADPLVVLFVHSDRDGFINPAQAGPLADRLAEILPLLPDEVAPGHIGHWHTKTQAFIDGLRLAVATGDAVTFE